MSFITNLSSPAPRQITILLVEDEVLIAFTEKRQLEGEGYHVIHVLSGEEAIERVNAAPLSIDLVLMDINLGDGLDGTQAAQQILAYHNIPILFVSGHTDKATVEKSEKITSYGYVVKNSSPAVLFASVKMALKLFNADQRIHEHESDYRALFETSLNAIALHEIVLDEQGLPVDYIFLRVNAAFEEHSGLQASQVVNQRVTQVIPNIEKTGLIELYGRVALTGEPAAFEVFMEALQKHFSVKAYQAGPGRFAVVFENITERKQAEQQIRASNDRLRLVIENSNAGYFRLNRQGQFSEVNQAWLVMHGYERPEEVVGQHFALTQVHDDLPAAEALVRRMLAGEALPSGEFTRLMKDGSIGYHRYSLTPVTEDGQVSGIEGFLIDTTQAKQDETLRRQAELKFQNLFERAPLGYQSLDFDGNFIEVNQAWLDILGYERQEVIGRWFGDFLPLDGQAAFRQRFPRFKAQGNIHSEFAMLHKDGSQRMLAFEGRIGYKEDGSFLQTHCILADITERLQHEQAMRASDMRYQTIFNGSLNAIMVADDQGRYQAANPAAIELFGYPLEQLLGMRVSDLRSTIPPDAGERYRAYLEKGSEVGEFEFVRPDGEVRIAQYFASRVQENMNLSILNDITHRKKIENELQQNRKILQAIIDKSTTQLVYLDLDFNFVTVNAAYCQSTQCAADELIGKNHFTYFPHAENEAIFRQVRDTGQPVSYHDKPFTFPGQPQRGITYWDWNLSPVKDEAGVVQGLVLSLVETTERVLGEEKLKISQHIVSSTPDGIAYLDRNYRYLMVNDAYERYSGIRREDFIGLNVAEYLGQDVFEQTIRPRFERCLQGEIIQYQEWFTFPIIGRRYIHVTYFPYGDAQGQITGIFANSRDMTEQREAEEKVFNLLEEKEILLREVHHRIKNNMFTITSLLNLQMSTMEGESGKVALQDAIGRIQSMMVLYNRLYRSENITTLALSDYIPPLMTEIVGIFTQAEHIKVVTHIDDIVLKVEALSLLGIILNELITNSMKYAFQGRQGGTITFNATHLNNEASGSASGIELTFGDDGVGLPEQIDFTHTPSLGLQLVDMLVRQLKGTISIERNGGTRYKIVMPG